MRSHFIEHRLPGGQSVFFRHTKKNGDEDHSYWRGCEPERKTKPDEGWKGVGQLTGISTVVAPFDFRPDALMKWAARTNGIGIAQLVEEAFSDAERGGRLQDDLSWLTDHRKIWDRLERDGLTFRDLRDQRAEEGTNVHKHALQALAEGKAIPDYEKLTDAEHGYARGVGAFWMEHMPTRTTDLEHPTLAEAVVADLDLGLAGTLDYRGVFTEKCSRSWCACQGLGPVSTVVLDAKTSGFIPVKHHAQVVSYDRLAVTSGYDEQPAALCVILQVDEDGGWQLIPAEADWTDLDIALNAYRRSQAISSTAAKARKAREEAAA